MLEALQCIDTAVSGHGDVEHHHVDLALSDVFNDFRPVRCFCNDVQVIMAGNELPDSGSNYSVIVGDKDSNHGDCREFLACFPKLRWLIRALLLLDICTLPAALRITR